MKTKPMSHATIRKIFQGLTALKTCICWKDIALKNVSLHLALRFPDETQWLGLRAEGGPHLPGHQECGGQG